MNPIGQFIFGIHLTARRIRRILLKGDAEDRKTLLKQFDSDTWLDVLGFVVDEMDSKDELSDWVQELIGHGLGVTMKAAGYALFRKPNLIKETVRDFYTSKRIEEDSQRVVQDVG